jgi:hypothetical protein
LMRAITLTKWIDLSDGNSRKETHGNLTAQRLNFLYKTLTEEHA